MSVIAFVSGKGSPGATCSVLGLASAWPLRAHGDGRAPERVLVVEADPAGSSLVPGFLRGHLDPGAGMARVLEAEDSTMPQALRQAVLELDGGPGRYVLPGLPSPTLAAAHQQAWPQVAQCLTGLSWADSCADVLVDLGRVPAAAEPVGLLAVADLVVVVCRATLVSVHAAYAAAGYLDGLSCEGVYDAPTVCLLVGHGPYTDAEVDDTLQLPVVGALDWDPAAAAVFAEGRPPGRGFTRGPLLRSATRVARQLVNQLAAQAAVLAVLDEDTGTLARPPQTAGADV